MHVSFFSHDSFKYFPPWKTFHHPSLICMLAICFLTGAKQPNYLVTADDVGTYLAIEVQPLDNRKRKVFLWVSILA